MTNDEMIQRVERETRQLIGDQAIQIIILRAALEMSKPWPKDGKIPPQPEVEDHPPMDWPKGKAWNPERREDHPRGRPQDDLVGPSPDPQKPQPNPTPQPHEPGHPGPSPDIPPPNPNRSPVPDPARGKAMNGKAQTMNG